MKTKEMKGITLVALIVTIVVLLILAGVSINLVLGDNGIIAKAKDAKTKSAEASENDLKGMNSLVSEMEGTLAGNGGAGGSGAGTKVPAEATAETAPYFPDNTFTKKEGTIDTGLVIQDASGNEYVWVVVPKSLYNNTAYNSNNVKKPSSSTDYANIEYCLQQYTATYRNGTSYSDVYYPDGKNVGWFTNETAYNNLKNSMLKSVYENGGFYVGRYEAGIAENRTSNTDKNSEGKYITPSTAPVTKADAYPYTYVTRTQAQNLASNVNSGTKTSSLMFGVQWDLVLAFMHNKGNIEDSTLTSNSTTIGNYRDSVFQLSQTGQYAVYSNYSLSSTWNPSTTATTNFVDSSRNKIAQSSNGNGILVTTGTSEKNKVMNIYDVAGNVIEWTLEKTSDTNYPCARRGGYYDSTGSGIPAADRNGSSTDYSVVFFGFRVSLF
ncbi:MAG: hypothetical protein ACLSWT_04315 [Clostridia bacterium]